MKWTRIADTELAIEAWKILDSCDLEYHNGWHVLSMYEYLHDTNEPYDEALDWAILFHDIVYDDKPQKEYRSAVKFSDMKAKHSGCNLSLLDEGHVVSLILATENHLVTYPGHSAIIRADLHQLADPICMLYNYMSIMNESMYLYKIYENDFAENNVKFMKGLYERMDQNIVSDPMHAHFYGLVKRGIKYTMNISLMLEGKL
jgi:predicted metal-dependent HD superfamily phosphohydrolase